MARPDSKDPSRERWRQQGRHPRADLGSSLFCFGGFFWAFLAFLGPLPRHMEVPRPRVESEL